MNTIEKMMNVADITLPGAVRAVSLVREALAPLAGFGLPSVHIEVSASGYVSVSVHNCDPDRLEQAGLRNGRALGEGHGWTGELQIGDFVCDVFYTPNTQEGT